MEMIFFKTQYWIRYNHEGVEDNSYGRYIVVNKLVLGEDPYLIAFCRKSHQKRKFKLSGIIECEEWLKDNKKLLEGMRATHKKGAF